MEVFRIAIVDNFGTFGRCDQQSLAVENAVEPDQSVIGYLLNPSQEVNAVWLLEQSLQDRTLLHSRQASVGAEQRRQKDAICCKAWEQNGEKVRKLPCIYLQRLQLLVVEIVRDSYCRGGSGCCGDHNGTTVRYWCTTRTRVGDSSFEEPAQQDARQMMGIEAVKPLTLPPRLLRIASIDSYSHRSTLQHNRSSLHRSVIALLQNS